MRVHLPVFFAAAAVVVLLLNCDASAADTYKTCADVFRVLPIHYGTVFFNLPGLSITFSSVRGSLTLYKTELCFSASDRRYSEHDKCFAIQDFVKERRVIYSGGRHFSFGGVTVEQTETKQKAVFSTFYGSTVTENVKQLAECTSGRSGRG